MCSNMYIKQTNPSFLNNFNARDLPCILSPVRSLTYSLAHLLTTQA